MKVVRSDTPEVARCIASGGTRASRHWPALAYGSQQNIIILLIAVIVSFSVSVRAAVWLGLSALLVWNAYVLWWTKSSRLNWCIAVCPERVYLRLFMMRGGARHCADSPDVVVLAASEIASMSIRTVEVFLYGPKPKSVECLVIEPAQAVAERVSNHIRPLLRPLDAGKVILVANEKGRRRNWHLLRTYGLSSTDYATLLAKQGGGCAICGRLPARGKRALNVDHDHTTGKIRGLLCDNCNNGLGLFRDNVDLLLAAGLYLESVR